MNISRFGFNFIVAVYLAPLIVLDLWGNTFTTGDLSDYYFYKVFVDGTFMALALIFMFSGETASVSRAAERVASPDEVVSFEKIGAVEYIYCFGIAAYALANFLFLHQVNKASEGIVSFSTLIWSILSIIVGVIGLIHFWRLKSGQIVALKKKILS
jgi:hypothetical protein